MKKFFTVPSAAVIARKDLENAKRDLLQMQATAEHANKMVEFYSGVVSRLTAYTQDCAAQGL